MGTFKIANFPFYKLLNLFMRGISMGSKFLFILYISKFMEVDQYGEFNLLVTSVTFLIFFLGLDYYSFTAREIMAISGEKRFVFIKHQFFFHAVLYIAFLPIIYLFCRQFLDTSIFFAFYILLISEHFSQELYRIFIFHNKHIVANGLLMLRTFFWVVLVCFDVLVIKAHSFSTELIVGYWILGSSLSFLVGLYFLYKTYPVPMSKLFDFSDMRVHLIKKGLVICLPILAGTISYKLIEYSDRFIIDLILGKEQVGIYSLFSNFSNIVNIVVNTVVTLMIFPKMVEAVKKKQLNNYFFYKKKFRNELIVVTVLTSILLCILIYPTLDWIGKEEYKGFLIGFFFLVVGNIFLNLSFLPHYLLYAFNKDKKNIMPMIWAMAVNIIVTTLSLMIFKNILGAAIATMLSFMLIYMMKTYNWVKFDQSNFSCHDE